MRDLTAHKFLSIKNNINGVDGINVIIETNIKNSRTRFLIPRAKLAFAKLKKAFKSTPMLFYFDPEYYIRIKTDVLGYAIDKIVNQLILNDVGQ